MYIGADEGCHEVPDPIAPIDIAFFSLEPIRMPMSSPFITSSGPISTFVPPMFMPGIWPIGLGDGLAEGVGIFISGIFICGCGEAVGDGEAAGICIPGISFILAGLGDGDGVGE